MPELRLFPLTEKVSDAHMSVLTKELQELGVKEFPEPDEDALDLEEPLGDDQLTDFMDRLEAHMVRFEEKLDGFHQALREQARTYVLTMTGVMASFAAVVVATGILN